MLDWMHPRYDNAHRYADRYPAGPSGGTGKSIEMRYAGERTQPIVPRETRLRDRSLAGKARVRARRRARAARRSVREAGVL